MSKGKIGKYYTDKSKWCQGRSAVDINGIEVEIGDTDVHAMCLIGATIALYPDFDDRARVGRLIIKEIDESIANWNDTHTFEEVVALVAKLEI